MIDMMPDPPKYPLDSFPLSIRNVALEMERNIQAPAALIGMGLLGGMSVACQGVADGKSPTGQKVAMSLNLIGIAESGERKTAVDKHVFAALYEHDRLKAVAYQDAGNEYQVQREIWEVTRRVLRHRLAKAISNGDSVDELSKEMTAHTKVKPKKRRLRRVMRQNITARAIMEALEGDGESIAITTDEGQVLFKSNAMTQLGLLNKAWDGAPLLTFDRADMDQILVMNPRVTTSILTQKAVLQAYLKKHGEVARGSGHWARYLVAWPVSTQGYRCVDPEEQVWVHLPVFQARMKELLEKYDAMIDTGVVSRELVEFSEDAKSRWFELAAQTEWMLRPGEYLHDINDFASKAMEILVRVAAVFHYFSGEDGKISLDTLMRAFTVLRWHVDEFKRLFSQQLAVTQEQVDAQAVTKYLRERIWKGPNSNTFVHKNDVLHQGPVRQRDRLNAAMRALESQGAVWIRTLGKGTKLTVQLSDQYFASM